MAGGRRGGKRKRHGKRVVDSNKKKRLKFNDHKNKAEAREKVPTVRREATKRPVESELSSGSEEEEHTGSAYSILVSSLAPTGRRKEHLSENENSDISDDESDYDDEDGEEDLEDEVDEEEAISGDEGEEEAEEEDDVEEGEDEEGGKEGGESGDDVSEDTAELGEQSNEEKANEEEEINHDDLEDIDTAEDASPDVDSMSDPYICHFDKDLDDKDANKLNEAASWEKLELKIPMFGKCFRYKPTALQKTEIDFKESDLVKTHVKQALVRRIEGANTKHANVNLRDGEILTPFQQRLFAIMNSYQDLYYADRTFENGEELRLTYCLHALNHIVKTRNNVITHNTKLKTKTADPDQEFRDQGFTRPKVLIVLPFRESAYRVVRMMMSLLMPDEDKGVMNKNRFFKEYGFDGEEPTNPAAKPDDYNQTFARNIDDHFRIGIGVAKKTLKLYSEFYKADIIIASPLGLRSAIGAEGDKVRDFDFLSSIEVLVMDQMDNFLMQNWDHVKHLLDHMHLQPRDSHGVDFSRIRMWILNGWSKFYQQTLVFSSFPTPLINGLFNKQCKNFAGKIQIPKSPSEGTIRQVVTQLPQVWHRINVKSHAEAPNERFKFFVEKILPKINDETMRGVLLFIPSYFDFVRLRNYFKKEHIDFVFCNEYTKDKTITRSRGLFFHGKVRILMYTERCHFYRRFKLRGIRHIVFYDLPLYSHFYSELCNFLRDYKKPNAGADDNHTCHVMYTKYDAQKLAGIVGTTRAGQMIMADKSVHMLVTGET